ncbi:MAG: lipopolysaccharide biosynthesis protein [Thermoguttaceae bacterium]|nr:lipopolysaccharide biosynthesis protein [Thermoguttaceae bacterium]
MADDQNLAQRSFKAASWVLVFQFATQFIQLFLGICLARLLCPEDYGILGMLAIFWSISQMFIDGGFGSALIQKKEVTEEDYCSVFYYNLLLSFLFCFAMIAAAPWFADFYHQPILRRTIVVSAWTLPIGAVVSIHQKILQRSLRQGLNSFIGLVTLPISGGVALYLAWKGYGVWALVWQPVIAAICRSLLLIFFVRWTPKLIFSFSALKSLFGFGSKMLVSGLLDGIFSNLYSLVIGKCYDARLLGFYSRANSYANLWPHSVQGAIAGVLFPAFAKMQDDLTRLKAAFRRSLCMSIFVVVFPSYLLCTLSRPFIELVLNPRWLPCIPYWWMITSMVIFWPIHVLNLQLLKARGRSDLFLGLEIIKKLLALVSIAILIFFGLMPMLSFGIFSSALCAYLNSFFTGKELGYGLFRQLSDAAIYVILAVISCVLAWGAYVLIYPHSPWLGLIIPAAFGCLCYGGSNLLLKTDASTELIRLLIGRFPFLKKFLGRFAAQ